MGLVRKSLVGMEIDFIKDKINNCTTCEYGIKKIFRKNILVVIH